jgi:hypothetical protein
MGSFRVKLADRAPAAHNLGVRPPACVRYDKRIKVFCFFSSEKKILLS